MGECYLHGMMDGEAVQLWKAGKLPSQEFELH